MAGQIDNNGYVNNRKDAQTQKEPENRIIHNRNLLVNHQLDPQKIDVKIKLDNTRKTLALSTPNRAAKREAKETSPALSPISTKTRYSDLENRCFLLIDNNDIGEKLLLSILDGSLTRATGGFLNVLTTDQNPNTNSNCSQNEESNRRVENIEPGNLIHNFSFNLANCQETTKNSIVPTMPLVNTEITADQEVSWEKAGVTKVAIEEALAKSRKNSESNPANVESSLIDNNLTKSNSSVNGVWIKVIYLRPGMEIAVYDQNSLSWEKIIAIEPKGEEHVYDLMIENTHNFVANGIVAHNTYISSYLQVGGSEITTYSRFGSGTTSQARNLITKEFIRSGSILGQVASGRPISRTTTRNSTGTIYRAGISQGTNCTKSYRIIPRWRYIYSIRLINTITMYIFYFISTNIFFCYIIICFT